MLWSRRNFVSGAGLLLAGSMLPDAAWGLEAVLPKEITFRGALRKERLRQEYITLLAEDLFKNSTQKNAVADWVYDHDGSLAKKLMMDQYAEWTSSSDFFEDMRHELRTAHLGSSLMRSFVKKAKKSPKNVDELRALSGDDSVVQKYADFRKRKRKKEIDLFSSDIFAMCSVPKPVSEKMVKPTVYIFGNMFEPIRLFSNGYSISPNEDLVRSIMVHELQHAADGYYGFGFDTGLVLSYRQVLSAGNEVYEFIAESRAHIAQINYAESVSGKRNLCDHPLYLYEALQFHKRVWNYPLARKEFADYFARHVDAKLGQAILLQRERVEETARKINSAVIKANAFPRILSDWQM